MLLSLLTVLSVSAFATTNGCLEGDRSNLKTIKKIFKPMSIPEGDGATVRRIIGTRDLQRLDPFLMLDHFFVKLPAGFPDHPHRGFETVTYMQKGVFYHEDFKGHKGKIEAGDIQWMTAGKGIVHAEMPGSWDEESVGFQLWLNLRSDQRLIEPHYQEYTKDQIPSVSREGTIIKVIAGESLGVKGPIVARTPAFYLDVVMEESTCYTHKIPKGWNSLIYNYEGTCLVGSSKSRVEEGATAVFANEEREDLTVLSGDGQSCKFILLAGLALNEPIKQHGPFVLSTQKELEDSFNDYRYARNGFEGAHEWRSEISNMRNRRSDL